jgi:hypothetical protein
MMESPSNFQSPEDKIRANFPSVVYIKYTSGTGQLLPQYRNIKQSIATNENHFILTVF